MSIPAFDPPAKTPSARRAALAKESDAAIGERLASLASSLRAIDRRGLHAIADAARLPIAEVIASPFALRAVAISLEVGASTAHGELRARPDWPDVIEGIADEVRDPDHGSWDRGVLKTGKYQAFLADEAFAIYDPSHVSKWGPHELLHRAAGFFYRRGASRWEHYLGARLNELVPVVTWYGAEQTLRLDEDAFDREAAGRTPAASLDRALWLDAKGAALKKRAKEHAAIFRAGLAHFERELASIDREIETGLRVRTPHPFLDASSDATAYVAAHFERLRDENVNVAIETAPELSSDSIAAYRDRIEVLFDRLLFAPIELDLELVRARQRARAIYDLVHRAAHFGDPVDAIAKRAAPEIAGAWRGSPVNSGKFHAALDTLPHRDQIVRNGLDAHAVDQLELGLSSVAPCALALAPDLEAFSRSDEIRERAPLALRFARFAGRSGRHPAVREMAIFEQAIASARRDDQIERLTTPEEEVSEIEEGLIVRSRAFERLELEHAIVEAHAALSAGEKVEMPERAPMGWLVGAHGEEVAVVPCPEPIRAAWAYLEDRRRPARELIAMIDRAEKMPPGMPADGKAWLFELLRAGAIGWSPSEVGSPRRRRKA